MVSLITKVSRITNVSVTVIVSVIVSGSFLQLDDTAMKVNTKSKEISVLIMLNAGLKVKVNIRTEIFYEFTLK